MANSVAVHQGRSKGERNIELRITENYTRNIYASSLEEASSMVSSEVRHAKAVGLIISEVDMLDQLRKCWC